MYFRANRRLRLFLVAVLIVVIYGLLVLKRPSETGRVKLPAGGVAPLVSVGSSHGTVLAPDGSMWSWGGEDSGWPVLGLGNTNFTAVLRRIGSETNWTCVSAGTDHNLALKTDGTIWAWGANYDSQLGDGTRTMRSSPVPSVPGNDWTQVVAGFVSSYALRKDGTLWAWGLNNFGQLA
jgi:alpha-tubulin suppressor-like RCC1 family protein